MLSVNISGRLYRDPQSTTIDGVKVTHLALRVWTPPYDGGTAPTKDPSDLPPDSSEVTWCRISYYGTVGKWASKNLQKDDFVHVVGMAKVAPVMAGKQYSALFVRGWQVRK